MTIPISSQYSLTASAEEENKGQGSLLVEGRLSETSIKVIAKMPKIRWRSREKRHPSSKLVRKSYSLKTGKPAVAHRSIFRRASDEVERWNLNAVGWLGDYDEAGVNEGSRFSKPVQRTRIELKRDSKADSLAIERRDLKLGKINLQFVPRKRVSASLTVKEAVWRKARNASFVTPQTAVPKDAKRRRSSSHITVKTALDYRWKGHSWTLTNTVEGFHAILSLVTRLHPFRLSPRVQIPLGRSTKKQPWMSWTHVPGSSLGEIEIGRDGLAVSAYWPDPKVSLKQKGRNGSSTQLSLNSKGVFSLDKTIVSEPMLNSAVLTLSTHTGNGKDDSSLTATLAGQYGLLSVFANTSQSLSIMADINIDRKNRAYSALINLQTGKSLEARLGFFL